MPINGGSSGDGSGGSGTASGGNGDSGGSPVTVVRTVTLPPKSTSSPAETQRVTDTIVLTASPSVVTQTAVLTVDIVAPPETETTTSVVYITPSLALSALSSSPPVASPTFPSSFPTQSVTLSASPSASESCQPTASSSPETLGAVSATFSSILRTSTLQTAITMLPTPSTSSRTFDDGMWHTTYPPWSGPFNGRAARP